MKKLDLKKQLEYLYTPSARKPALVKVPRMQFAAIDGAIEKGAEPGTSPSFQEAMMALYGLSYTLKFNSKLRKKNPIDYRVMALEGLWWVVDGQFDITVKDNWHYTLMMLQPGHISQAMFEAAREEVRRKRGETRALAQASLEHFDEGLCVQIMHVGPYATEPATIQIMRAFAAANGYRDRVGPDGKHHEIYLGDPRRAKPEKLRTVVRHPVEKM